MVAGNVVCHIGEGCSAEVEAAVAAAQAAMDGPWSKTTVAQRAGCTPLCGKPAAA